MRDALSQYMLPDQYGEYLVQNLYFDTDRWDVVRSSIEKPIYKEKMRLRCYGVPTDDSRAFLELKKKYKGIVYKRRVSYQLSDFHGNTVGSLLGKGDCQIANELAFYLRTNGVSEKVFISYHRLALAGLEDDGLRITFDSDIRCRFDQLDFTRPCGGYALLPEDMTLMEIKTLGGMPMWLTRSLGVNRIFPTTFSKLGRCYTDFIVNQPNQSEWVSISA
jgi:SPX domain protein involved in polyphosphate accumulation